MFRQPLVHVEAEVLLGPQHPRQRLAHHEGLILTQPLRGDAVKKFVRLAPAGFYRLRGVLKGIADRGRGLVAEPHADGGRLPRVQAELILDRSFCSRVPGIDGIRGSVHHVVVDSVLHVR